MIKENQLAQLYEYNEDSYIVTKNSPGYYATNFQEQKLSSNPENKVYWLNFHDLSYREAYEELIDKIKLDRMIIEEIYNDVKRPKIEEFNSNLYFSINSALTNKINPSALNNEKICFILGKDFLISFQERKSDHFTEVRERIEKKKGKIRTKGADFLLFRLLDAITDNYFEVLEDIVEKIESIEKKITSHPDAKYLKLIEYEKRKLVELRKLVYPLKDITIQLTNQHENYIKDENTTYFNTLKDNCLAILDEIDANKQMLDGLANLYYAIQGQKMNEIMKLLTIMSSIFIPLTFIAGIYGMNFDYIPELKIKFAYFYVIGLMVIIALILIYYFKKKGWFKN